VWRIVPTLAASVIVHGALVGALLSREADDSAHPDVVVVDLVGAEPPAPATDDRVAALVTERDELAQRLDTETAARARLGEEVAELTAGTLALESELAEARRHAARLERSLAERQTEAAVAMRELEQTHGALLAALRDEISEKDVALRRVREGLTVSIVDRVLFPSGQATLTPEGRGVIDKVGRVFAATPPRRVIIEGHTDNVPIGPELRARFPTNWELAAARATEVVRRFVEQGMSPDVLEAVGRGDTRPVASNDTGEGRRRNRRIAIIVPGSIESAGDEPGS
jgi:chemotaxis protein MotB